MSKKKIFQETATTNKVNNNIGFFQKTASTLDLRKNGKSGSNECVMPLCHFKGKNVWILKPTNLNRGKGIHVVSSFKKLKRLIRDYCRGKE